MHNQKYVRFGKPEANIFIPHYCGADSWQQPLLTSRLPLA